MKCLFCQMPIQQGDVVNQHHVIYRSQGGTETKPAHAECHRHHHSSQGDFKSWGRIGGQITALTRRWAFNLKNVRTNPAYDFDRAYYRALYAH
jgi:hypothetical protein